MSYINPYQATWKENMHSWDSMQWLTVIDTVVNHLPFCGIYIVFNYAALHGTILNTIYIVVMIAMNLMHLPTSDHISRRYFQEWWNWILNNYIHRNIQVLEMIFAILKKEEKLYIYKTNAAFFKSYTRWLFLNWP